MNAIPNLNISHLSARALSMVQRLLLLVAITLTTCLGADAQAMSDTQLADYARTRYEEGVAPMTIAKELIERGATRDQILRLRQAYENGTTTTPKATSHSETGTNIDRSRKDNAPRLQNGKRTTADEHRLTDADALPSQPWAEDGKDAWDFDVDALWHMNRANSTPIFGHDTFRQRMLSFEPNMAIDVPADYVIGPGDELIIDIYGDSQRSDKHTVAPDGCVTLDYAGPVTVGGRTMKQVQSLISSRLRPYYGGSTVKVTVGQTRTITVNIMGEVKTPGSYTLSAFASVFHALYQAGGVTDIGTLRAVKVCRDGRVTATVDVYDYILNGRLAGNILLRNGDVILVDTYGTLVEIEGWVKRPMRYEMRPDESLATLIAYAGGMHSMAYSHHVTIERSEESRAYVLTPEADDFSRTLLKDGDVVKVGRDVTRYVNMAIVQGAVMRPGRYEMSERMTTVGGIIEQAGGLSDDALRTRAVLLRKLADGSRSAITIDLDGILAGTSPDVALHNEDELTISSRAIEIERRHLHIDGEIYNPGQYRYAEGLTVEDLIVMAGGLKESASLLNVEVSRRIVNPEGNEDRPQRAEIYNIELKGGMDILTQTGFVLQPYDEVYVRKSPEYSEQCGVWVQGEVLFEGRYVLENQSERLSDVVKRTGGMTSKASIADARLERRMNETELARRAKLIEKAQQEADSLALSRLDLKETYTVGIDLREAMAHPGGKADLVLRDGDVLFIPQLENTVKINGEVLYPNTVTYNIGKTLRYYINQAGGYSKTGSRRHAYIIYNNGQVSRARNGRILPGCEIVVPTKKHRENSKAIATTLSISTALATVAAVLVSSLK